MDFGDSWLFSRVMLLIPIVLSLSVHEWAHAWTAYQLGDDTAARMGRLTLNPLAHMDPIGTFLLPLVVPFGWAKPVPVNPTRFSPGVSMGTGMMLTAVAGPLSNLVLAAACAVGMLLGTAGPDFLARQEALWALMRLAIFLNLALALFNMLPIHPLDGSRVVDGLLSDGTRPLWERSKRYGVVALILLLVVPELLGFGLLTGLFDLFGGMMDWLLAKAGP